MSYLIAKKYNEAGCLAVEVEPDSALAGLVTYLGLRTLDKGIEILTVSDMDIWYEYKPYNVVESEKEFIFRVLSFLEEDEEHNHDFMNDPT